MKNITTKILIILFFVILHVSYGKESTLLSILNEITEVDFCGEKVPLENQEVLERFEKEFMLKLWDKPQVYLWLKRANRYFPLIETMLKNNGLPDDLKYITVIESALLSSIGSAKGAMGFWQFTESTGRKYGLVIESDIDERRNIIKSTNAAINYFKSLYDTLDNWTLVAAAYNMGENGLLAEIEIQNTRDYYQLYLPLETQRYLFKILSAKLIFSYSKDFGFQIDKADFYPQLHFDVVELDCDEPIPLQIVARAAGTSFKVIKDLNPEIRGYYLPQGSHTVLIPDGTEPIFYKNYPNRLQEWLVIKNENIYTVQEGDHLSSIAEKFGVPLKTIQIWNRLEDHATLFPGDRLIIIKNLY